MTEPQRAFLICVGPIVIIAILVGLGVSYFKLSTIGQSVTSAF